MVHESSGSLLNVSPDIFMPDNMQAAQAALKASQLYWKDFSVASIWDRGGWDCRDKQRMRCSVSGARNILRRSSFSPGRGGGLSVFDTSWNGVVRVEGDKVNNSESLLSLLLWKHCHKRLRTPENEGETHTKEAVTSAFPQFRKESWIVPCCKIHIN